MRMVTARRGNELTQKQGQRGFVLILDLGYYDPVSSFSQEIHAFM